MVDSAEIRTLLFRLGESTYGCDLSLVREIIPYRRATRLPGAPAYVHGLINLRGNILTVVDLGTRLEPERPLVVDGSIIIIGVDGRQVGFAVSDVMDVAPVRAESTGARVGGDDDVVRGVGHLGATVVILLDVRALVGQVLV